MARTRRGGYIFTTWKGDHEPRHVHVADGNGKFLGRIEIVSKRPLDQWQPPAKLVALIDQLRAEGRL